MSHLSNPDTRPLPDGWVTEYSPEWNAWYYVNSRSANPEAVWTHPTDGESPTTTTATSSLPATSHTGGGDAPPGPNQNATEPVNPDTRPLPDGWINEYSPDHKRFFYVDTKAADPSTTVTWTHPAAGMSHGAEKKRNPDTRPLPPGWITDYDENHNAWYYGDPTGGSTWTHPADTHPQLAATLSPAPAPGTASTSVPAPVGNQPAPPYPGKSPQKVAAALPSPAVQVAPVATASAIPARENPDKRPLPPGYITKFDENYKTWYYVDTSKPGGSPSWEHPADKLTTSPVLSPTTLGGSRPPGTSNTPSTASGIPQNPDKRPLPAGWVSQYDRNSKKWFYIKTTVRPPLTSWQHPLDNAQPTPTPNPSGPQQAPNGPPPGNSTTPGAGRGLEGLLGSKAGGIVGGLFGTKGRAQMDGFADILGGEINRYRQSGKVGAAGVPAPSQAPPGPAPSQYQPPAGQVPGQYIAPPASQPPPTTSGGGGLAGKFGFGKK